MNSMTHTSWKSLEQHQQIVRAGYAGYSYISGVESKHTYSNQNGTKLEPKYLMDIMNIKEARARAITQFLRYEIIFIVLYQGVLGLLRNCKTTPNSQLIKEF